MRESHLRVMHPPRGDGWVMVAQNGLKYTFDATKVSPQSRFICARQFVSPGPDTARKLTDFYQK